jgi:hypothetical protein
MSNLLPPVFPFQRLKPVTMTIIISYDAGELNLPAIFGLLPVTDQVLPAVNFQKKQGKIRLPPELNRPGEILSMRYDKKVRGIIRSESPKSFSHSIIIDIGTSDRIISAKLSPTIELTGPTSFAIAREAAEAILNHLRKAQENLHFIRENRETALQLKDDFLNWFVGTWSGVDSQIKEPTDELGQKIWSIFKQTTKGYSPDLIELPLSFILTSNRDLYTGTLKLGSFDSEMVNIQFNLGFSIDQIAFAKIMDREPFTCTFVNAKTASAVNVHYNYIKYDRSTGQPKPSKHTIRTNKSGHVRHSGPNLETMEPVYNSFMQRVLLHYADIQSIERKKMQLKIIGLHKCLSIQEWKQLLKEEDEFREKVMTGQVPIAITAPPAVARTVYTAERSEVTMDGLVRVILPSPPILEIIEHTITLEIIETSFISLQPQAPIFQESCIPELQFNYTPILLQNGLA